MMEAVKRARSSILQPKRTYLPAVIGLVLCSFANTALADSDGQLMVCYWEGLSSYFIKPGSSFRDVIEPEMVQKLEEYDCDKDGKYCLYRYYWDIPNRIYTIAASVKVSCLNMGNKPGPVKFSFWKNYTLKPTYFRNLTMRIAGAGSVYLSGLENEDRPGIIVRQWTDGTLAPCKTHCFNMYEGQPRYSKTLTFTFTVQPIMSKVYVSSKPTFDNINMLGDIWVHASDSNPNSYASTGTSLPVICGLEFSDSKGCTPSNGNSESGAISPPVPPCTLTITTPGAVEFQPISSDDLSRNRVRMEDFTLTATKGPVQSQICVGSTYNLPGTIKTEGGYSISSTFWGINHSSGSPQGIGLKLFDLDKGNYLQFNHTYPAFIANISNVSETKRIRAEIATTTNDLKKIMGGDYSQILTFEVKMP